MPRSRNQEILEMDVKNTSVLRSLMEVDCAPGQEIREITENAIQAVLARKDANPRFSGGEVQWRMYPNSLEKFSEPKLACIDNGEGMSPEELVDRIGRLASSGRFHGVDYNFGIGAKISALKISPDGVVFESWQKGKGHRVTLYKNYLGEPGLLRVSGKNAVKVKGHLVVERIPKSEMPDLIQSSAGTGTMVILLGEDRNSSNTLAPPEGFKGKRDDWVAWTLNHRYFRLPEEVEVKTALAKSKNPRVFTKITGVADFLYRNSKKSGMIEFDDLIIYWYQLKDHRSYSDEKNLFDSGAKVGAIFRDEIYDYYSGGVSAQNQMQHNFGIPFNANKVALFFEPKTAQPTPTRSEIKINSEPIPWDDWRRRFKKNMPKTIADMIAQNNTTSIKESRHLKGLRSFLGRRARLVSGKGTKIGGNPAFGKTKPTPQPSSGNAPSPPAAPSSSGSVSTKTRPKLPKETILLPGKTKPARRKYIDPVDLEPECVWGKGRDLGIEEGFFMKYLNDENKLLLNQDALFVREAEKFWIDAKHPNQKENVIAHIRELFTVQAIEVVVTIKQLEGQPGWDSDKVKKALEDDHQLNIGFTSRYFLDKILAMKMSQVPKRD